MIKNVPDPLSLNHALPIVTTLYPLGHALELSTDCEDVAAAAAALWSRYPKLSAAPPARFSIAVSPHDAANSPRPGIPRGREHLVSINHGPENCAVADLASAFAFASLTRDVARDHAWLGYHFLEPIAYILLLRSITLLHAACVAIDGRAILLAGDSGAGKTCLAYACARRGWSFLSGDACQFARNSNGTVIGRPFSIRFRKSARELFPELRRYPADNRLNGKLDIAPPVDDLGIHLATQARATAIVFLRRDATIARPAVRPLARGEAFARMSETIFVGDEKLRNDQRASLADFVDSLPIYEMTFPDTGDAERTLRTLLP